MSSQQIEQVLHILRQRSLEFHHFVGFWVPEFEHMGVQGGPVYNGLLDGGFGIGQLPGINNAAAVHIIGDDGVHLELHLPEQGSQKIPNFEKKAHTSGLLVSFSVK